MLDVEDYQSMVRQVNTMILNFQRLDHEMDQLLSVVDDRLEFMQSEALRWIKTLNSDYSIFIKTCSFFDYLDKNYSPVQFSSVQFSSVQFSSIKR